MDDPPIFEYKAKKQQITPVVQNCLGILVLLLGIVAYLIWSPDDYVPEFCQPARDALQKYLFGWLQKKDDPPEKKPYKILGHSSYGKNNRRIEIAVPAGKQWGEEKCRLIATQIWEEQGKYYDEYAVWIYVVQQDEEMMVYAVATFSRYKMKSFVQKGQK